MSMQQYKIDCPRENYDRKILIQRLKKYYITDDMETIKIKLRKDLKHRKSIKKLLKYTKYDIEEMLFHLAKIFDKLFNIILIRKLKAEIPFLED